MAAKTPTKTFADLEEKYDSFYAPAFEIDIDGTTQFSLAKGQASSVRIQTAVEKANRVSFSVTGVYDQSESDFTGLDEKGLETGNKLTVRVGYGSKFEPVMTGQITDLKPNFPSGGVPSVEVVGHDYRYSMDQAADDDAWDETTVEGAVESIAQEYDFERVEIGPEGPPTGMASKLELKKLIKDSKSDLAFLKSLVRDYDYEMYSQAGVLRFRRPPEKQGSPSASVELSYGTGLRSFQQTTGSGKSQVKKIKHKGVNPRTGETVSGSSERKQSQGAKGADEQRLLKAPMESDEEAEEKSKSKTTELNRQQNSSATTIGLPDLRIGEWVKLKGLGGIKDRDFGGLYYLEEVDHDFGNSGYTTKVSMSGPLPESK